MSVRSDLTRKLTIDILERIKQTHKLLVITGEEKAGAIGELQFLLQTSTIIQSSTLRSFRDAARQAGQDIDIDEFVDALAADIKLAIRTLDEEMEAKDQNDV